MHVKTRTCKIKKIEIIILLTVVGSWYVTSQAEPFPLHLENACSGVEIGDTDDAFEVDGDGADDTLDDELSESAGDEDA